MDFAIRLVIFCIGGSLISEGIFEKKRRLIHLIDGSILIVFSALLAWFK